MWEALKWQVPGASRGIDGFALSIYQEFKGGGFLMSATCVLWYVARGNTGLSKCGYPVFLHFCPLKQKPGLC